jgi:hypothetical protein
MVTGELEAMGYSWAYRRSMRARSDYRSDVARGTARVQGPRSRPVLLGVDHGAPPLVKRGNSACGFY